MEIKLDIGQCDISVDVRAEFDFEPGYKSHDRFEPDEPASWSGFRFFIQAKGKPDLDITDYINAATEQGLTDTAIEQHNDDDGPDPDAVYERWRDDDGYKC